MEILEIAVVRIQLFAAVDENGGNVVDEDLICLIKVPRLTFGRILGIEIV
jgi:hypothetical protein